VHAANDEEIIIDGAAYVQLRVGKRSVESEILITRDLHGLIIGIDWLEKQGQFVWDFREGRIRFENGEWIELQKKKNREEFVGSSLAKT